MPIYSVAALTDLATRALSCAGANATMAAATAEALVDAEFSRAPNRFLHGQCTGGKRETVLRVDEQCTAFRLEDDRNRIAVGATVSQMHRVLRNA